MLMERLFAMGIILTLLVLLLALSQFLVVLSDGFTRGLWIDQALQVSARSIAFGLLQRVEEFCGERLWLSFQNMRLVTAAPNPRKTVINASLDMSII